MAPAPRSSSVVADILPNELSLLDNVAYNIKFLMMHVTFPGITPFGDPIPLTTKNVGSFSHYIIAETGKTAGFVIKDLGFNHIVGAIRGVPALGIKGQLNIIEPYGMSLYERIFLAAQNLGIENHTLAKYVVQIQFRGYKPDGAQTVVEYDWIIPVMIQRMSSTITEQGSDYTIQFIGMAPHSNLSTSSSANETITVVASKFGEFLTKFTEILNKRQKELVDTETQKVPDVYEYKISPEWIIFRDRQKEYLSAADVSTVGTSINIADFDLGALHVDNVTASRSSDIVPEYGSNLNPQPNQIKITMSLGTNYNDHVMAVFLNTRNMQKLVKSESWDKDYNKWMIDIKDEDVALGFDIMRNDYAKKHIKTLHQHFMTGNIKDGKEFNNARINQEATALKIQLLTKHGLLRKAYYWIYTGLNTEVLNFSFGFDNLYYVATEVYSNVSLGEQRPDAGKGTIKSTEGMTIEDGSKIDAGASFGFEGESVTRAEIKQQFNRDNKVGGRNFKDGIYLEDLSLVRGLDGPFGNPRFIPEVIASDLVKSGGALPAQNVPRRIIANHISGDMMEITMTIKGDPFWLGEQTGATNDGAIADYTKGGNYLYIEFKVPDKINEHSGQMELSTANTISGLYRITKVDSNFSDGQFVQTLTGYLDITFALSQVRKLLPDPGGLNAN